jgi:hypothetical protein
VLSENGNLLKSFDIREITEDAGLKFLGRRLGGAPNYPLAREWLIRVITQSHCRFSAAG